METEFNSRFSLNARSIPESFIREILKVTSVEGTISFAGGLPNPELFPVKALAAATEQVFQKDPSLALQYSVSEGYLPLRQWIAERHSTHQRPVLCDQVLILNGSQQGIDLLGKIFIDPGQKVCMEAPSYLGAIQSFSAYQPRFDSIPLHSDGLDIEALRKSMKKQNPAFLYVIPDFQNPSGTHYSLEKRHQLAEVMREKDGLLIEDAAYREIYFGKEPLEDMYSLIPERTIHLGSFSKTVSPGLRLGYAIGPKEIIKKMCLAKQACDLHTNFLAQKILFNFLTNNDPGKHFFRLREFYSGRAAEMTKMLKMILPEVEFSKPRGGMFIWLKFPSDISSKKVLAEAIKQKVVFVPGNNFFINGKYGENMARFNYSNPTIKQMKKGLEEIKKAFEVVKEDSLVKS